jgi:hypothetical protein
MDVLQVLLQWVVDHGMLMNLGLHPRIPRALVYADDAVIFIWPSPADCEVLRAVLDLFGNPSGLHVNLQKSTAICILCDDATAQDVAHLLQCQLSGFPIRYLGLPLTNDRLRRADMWPLINKFLDRIPGWILRIMNPASRLILTRWVLMAFPLLFLAMLDIPV